MMERVNYYDYLGLNVGATENEIKQAISMKKKIMKQDGVELRDLTAVMLNEERKREELENFVRLLRKRREEQKASLINNPQINPKQAAQALLEEFGVRTPAKAKEEVSEVQEVPTEEVEQAVEEVAEEMAYEESVTAVEDENCFKAIDPLAGFMAKKPAIEVVVEEQESEKDALAQDVSAPVEEVVNESVEENVEQPMEEELSTEEVEEGTEETELEEIDRKLVLNSSIVGGLLLRGYLYIEYGKSISHILTEVYALMLWLESRIGICDIIVSTVLSKYPKVPRRVIELSDKLYTKSNDVGICAI